MQAPPICEAHKRGQPKRRRQKQRDRQDQYDDASGADKRPNPRTVAPTLRIPRRILGRRQRLPVFFALSHCRRTGRGLQPIRIGYTHWEAKFENGIFFQEGRWGWED
ncbi:hypothetical protein V8G54_022018 [Vigna mungo]|uniref:Uncharacterized protein n=1 Tax=Vigna mungo TaxID=3915 RepID=A0AAQ3RWB7_VIGMU